MKVFTITFFLFLNGVVFSQIQEGYFQYSIDVEAVDTLLKTRQTVGMLRNSKMELYFTEGKSRVDFKMGQVNEMSIIVDLSKKKVLSLNSSMMGKVARYGSTDDIPTPQKDPTIQIIYAKETKKILGYHCEKAILVKDSVEITYWVTDEIKVDDRIRQITDPNVPGFPMQFSKIQDGVLMTYEMSNIRESIENKEELFSVDVPEGYQLME